MSETVVEPGGDNRPIDPDAYVVHDTPDEVGGNEMKRLLSTDLARISPVLVRISELLQLDRSLPLVVDAVPHSEDRRDGVEKPARARSHRRVDTCLSEPRHVIPELSLTTRHPQVVGCRALESEVDKRSSHSPRLFDGR
jgi:hypothetical protein